MAKQICLCDAVMKDEAEFCTVHRWPPCCYGAIYGPDSCTCGTGGPTVNQVAWQYTPFQTRMQFRGDRQHFQEARKAAAQK